MPNQTEVEASASQPKIKGKITYFLSVEGQKASILAGGDGKQTQELLVEVAPQDLDLFNVHADGSLAFVGWPKRLRYFYNYMDKPEFLTDPPRFDAPQDYDSIIAFSRADHISADIATAIEENIQLFLGEGYSLPPGLPQDHPRRGELEAIQAQRDEAKRLKKEEAARADAAGKAEETAERVAAFLKNPDFDKAQVSKFVDPPEFYFQSTHWPSYGERFGLDSPHYAAIDAAWQADQARKQAQEDFLDTWIEEHGTDSEKERHAEGLLPRGEVFDHIKATLFGVRPKFNWKDSKPDCTCEYDNCAAAHDVDDAAELTEAEFESLKQLRADFPDAEVTPRVHKITRSTCEEQAKVAAGRVQITVGPFTFTRSFQL